MLVAKAEVGDQPGQPGGERAGPVAIPQIGIDQTAGDRVGVDRDQRRAAVGQHVHVLLQALAGALALGEHGDDNLADVGGFFVAGAHVGGDEPAVTCPGSAAPIAEVQQQGAGHADRNALEVLGEGELDLSVFGGGGRRPALHFPDQGADVLRICATEPEYCRRDALQLAGVRFARIAEGVVVGSCGRADGAADAAGT